MRRNAREFLNMNVYLLCATGVDVLDMPGGIAYILGHWISIWIGLVMDLGWKEQIFNSHRFYGP